MQPFVNVSSIVDLTTPTKVLHRHDMMDLTSPSSVLQAEDTNDESDFPLQDADDKHKVGGTEVGTADGGSNDLASPLQREDKEQGLGISSDVTMLDVKLIETQSQVANELMMIPRLKIMMLTQLMQLPWRKAASQSE